MVGRGIFVYCLDSRRMVVSDMMPWLGGKAVGMLDTFICTSTTSTDIRTVVVGVIYWEARLGWDGGGGGGGLA